jgi:demethylspheroidene O-methyltransferase
MASRDSLRRLRDRALASAKVRRAAAAFPLTRPIARRRAAALFDLCAGFVYSQVLQACVQLQLFESLAAGAQDAAALAARVQVPEASMRRLLDAAVALDLVDRRGQRYGLGALGAVLVGEPGLQQMIRHHALLYADLADPLGLLRQRPAPTRIGQFWIYAGAAEASAGTESTEVADRTRAYSRLMADTQRLIADEILAAYPFARHRRLLDIGGGDGAFVSAVAQHVPQLELQVLDLPAVADIARARFAREGLAQRATAIGGDFRAAPLPRGADVITLVRVAHDHDDAIVAALFAAARAALPDDGVLLVAEPMAGEGASARVADAYFGLYLLAMGQGRARKPAELGALLRAAGFARVAVKRTRIPLQTGLVIARCR